MTGVAILSVCSLGIKHEQREWVKCLMQVRYREGRPVTTKGEKYVVERIGEEWDGGSKGKVYTKGKRGKGVV